MSNNTDAFRCDPPPRELALLRERVTALQSASGARPLAGLFRRVRDVVIVASASRGGSSAISEWLRRSQAAVSLRGEINPYLRLNGLSFPYSGTDSDALAPGIDAATRSALEDDLAYDFGRPTDVLDSDGAVWNFAVDLAVRLAMQWPTVDIDLEDVHLCVRDTLTVLERTCGWRAGRFEGAAPFHARFLLALQKRVPEIDPFSFDLDPTLLASLGAERKLTGPPTDLLFEEPPFINITPWQPVTEEDLAARPVVIKTPSNAYRLRFLRSLFPRARLRIVHLTRNAAASINGLYDGWLHDGFYSHAVPAPLSIAGYSDRYPGWGRRWWKFDLPPGWRDRRSLPLERVCLWQWHSVHDAIQSFLDDGRLPAESTFRMRFEDVVRMEQRQKGLESLMRWVNPDQEPEAVTTAELPVVMATQPPTPWRWKRRAEIIAPLLNTVCVRRTMDALGYEGHPSEWG